MVSETGLAPIFTPTELEFFFKSVEDVLSVELLSSFFGVCYMVAIITIYVFQHWFGIYKAIIHAACDKRVFFDLSAILFFQSTQKY